MTGWEEGPSDCTVPVVRRESLRSETAQSAAQGGLKDKTEQFLEIVGLG